MKTFVYAAASKVYTTTLQGAFAQFQACTGLSSTASIASWIPAAEMFGCFQDTHT